MFTLTPGQGWKWKSGKTADYNNEYGIALYGGYSKSCVVMDENKKWIAGDCHSNWRYICEIYGNFFFFNIPKFLFIEAACKLVA